MLRMQGAGGMAQWIKVPANEPGGPSLIPRIHRKVGEINSHGLSSDLCNIHIYV